jgi:putative ATPase
MMDSLFEEPEPTAAPDESAPLAERMRPATLDEFVGQRHLLAEGRALRVALERDHIPSMILWGPPGVGKTSLARIVASMTGAEFLNFSAVLSGIKEIRAVMAAADRSRSRGHRTILFVDEIHRFNKAQQDAFLPYVESGAITLIGATTENPSFEVIGALLSRVRVFVLNPLDPDEIGTLVRRAAAKIGVRVSDEAHATIVGLADGDARGALNVLEIAAELTGGGTIGRDTVQNAVQRKLALYDKDGEEHYNQISALHKSIRNSDADAGLYWLTRMLEGGEDPLYVARRLVRFASEDVGLADPAALRVALDAKEAVAFVGLPEGALALAQCVIYLAAAPKSNSVYRAYGTVLSEVRQGQSDPVPLHLRNAPTRLMAGLGYGRGYEYAHGSADGVADMECLPERLAGRRFYEGRAVGAESDVVARLERARKLKKNIKSD